MQVVAQCIVNKIDIIAKNTDCHHAFDDCGVPVAIRKWSKVRKHWKKHAPEKVYCRLNLCYTPSCICVSNQLGRIYQFESTQEANRTASAPVISLRVEAHSFRMWIDAFAYSWSPVMHHIRAQ